MGDRMKVSFLVNIVIVIISMITHDASAQSRASCPTAKDAVFLDVNLQTEQELSLWCWAAVTHIATELILGANATKQQCQIVSERTGYDCCADLKPSACNSTGWPNFNQIEDITVRDKIDAALPFSALRDQFTGTSLVRETGKCEGRPVPFVWTYPNGVILRSDPRDDVPNYTVNSEKAVRHAMLAAGYVREGRDDYVFVVDPNRPGETNYIAGAETIEREHLRSYSGPNEAADRSIMLYEYYDRQDGHHEHYINYYNLRITGERPWLRENRP